MFLFSSERNKNLNILKNGLRIDGRNSSKAKSLTCVIGYGGKLCDVTSGGSRVIISSSIQPVSDIEIKKSKFIYTFEVNSNNIKDENLSQKLNFYSIENSLITLKHLFNEIKLYPFGKCLYPSNLYNWLVNFKIFIIENQGNIKDIIIFGISIILTSLQNPLHHIKGKTININLNHSYINLTRKFKNCFLVNFSFSCIQTLEGTHIILYDPNIYEENLSLSILTISLTFQNNILYLYSGIGPGITEDILKKAFRISLKRNKYIKHLLRHILNFKIFNYIDNETIFIIE